MRFEESHLLCPSDVWSISLRVINAWHIFIWIGYFEKFGSLHFKIDSILNVFTLHHISWRATFLVYQPIYVVHCFVPQMSGTLLLISNRHPPIHRIIKSDLIHFLGFTKCLHEVIGVNFVIAVLLSVLPQLDSVNARLISST